MKTFAKKQLESLRLRNVNALQHIHRLKESSVLFFVIAIVVVVATLFIHTFPRASEYKEAKDKISVLNYDISNLQKDKKGKKEEKEKVVNNYEKLRQDLEAKLNIIFPETENMIELTQFLEDFAMSAHSEEHPLEVNSISFGSPIKGDGDYYILPVRTNIIANADNFVRFMSMINMTGDLNYAFKKQAVRLMSIEGINVSVPIAKKDDDKKAPDGTYSFNVEINAYFKGSGIVPKGSPSK